MKKNFVEEQALKLMLAIDCTPRQILSKDKIMFRCFSCNNTGYKVFSEARRTLKKHGFAFQCYDCLRKKIDTKSPETKAKISLAKKGKPITENMAAANEQKRANKDLGNVRDFWSFGDINLLKLRLSDNVEGTCKSCSTIINRTLNKFVQAQNNETHGCPNCWALFTKSEEYAVIRRGYIENADPEWKTRHSEGLKMFWSKVKPEYMADWRFKSTQRWEEMTLEGQQQQLSNLHNGWRAWNNSLPDNYRSENNFWNTAGQTEIEETRINHAQMMQKRWQDKTDQEKTESIQKLRDGQLEAKDNGQAAYKKSAPELEILAWVHSLGYEAYSIYRTNKNTGESMECDIYIPELNIGIEHNGLYSHNETTKDNNYHLRKTQLFASYGIRIIHIFGHKWHYNKKQVKSFLRSALGKNQYKVGARQCEYRVIDKNTAKAFCYEYHMQQSAGGCDLNMGLYFENDLVAVACFGKHHRNNGSNVLKRFVCKDNWTVAGALSKFTKMAVKHYNTDIISWADLSVSDGKGYLSAGWAIEKIWGPDYFYFSSKGTNVTLTKQSRRKQAVRTPEGMTEHQHALLDGLKRVYDCGKMRLVYKKP